MIVWLVTISGLQLSYIGYKKKYNEYYTLENIGWYTEWLYEDYI